jgi:hypothetical protein
VCTEKIGLEFHLKIQEAWRLLDEQNWKLTEIVCNFMVNAANRASSWPAGTFSSPLFYYKSLNYGKTTDSEGTIHTDKRPVDILSKSIKNLPLSAR